MDMNRANECCGLYTKETKYVTTYIRDKAMEFNCPSILLKAPGKKRFPLELYNYAPVASHLAAQDTFSVPEHIMKALDRMIELRGECNEIHENLNPGAIAKNESHKHAIGIFQNLRRILLPKLTSTPLHGSTGMQTLSDINESWAIGEVGGLFGATIKFSFLSKGLKGMRQAIKRYWSGRKAGVNNNDAVISNVPSF